MTYEDPSISSPSSGLQTAPGLGAVSTTDNAAPTATAALYSSWSISSMAVSPSPESSAPSNAGHVSASMSAARDAHTGPIVGGALGGVAALALALCAALCVRRHRRRPPPSSAYLDLLHALDPAPRNVRVLASCRMPLDPPG